MERKVMVETEFITGNKPRKKTLLWPRHGAEAGVWSEAKRGARTLPPEHCAGRYKMASRPA